MAHSTPLAEDLIAQAKATGAKTLDLGRCGLTGWPDSLWELTELEELTMSNRWWDLEKEEWTETENKGLYNNLKEIPVEIQRLQNLTVLRAGGSGNIYWIGTRVFIDNWGIQDISVLQGLTNLQSLSLFDTKVSDISVLQGLTNLQSLDLAGSQITNISVLQGLTNLQSLSLQHTPIEDISVLQGLTNLQSLDLQHTPIEDISPLLPLIKKGISVVNQDYHYGEGINVFGCPLVRPSIEVVEQGREAILRYFEQLDQEGVDQIYEAKLLIVGKGGSGKTSLARKLIDRNAEMPDTDETTTGIDIQPLYFDHQGRQFRINIWDFGGQEIYTHTHQFFLTKRSLYLLVDDTRQSDQFREDKKAFNEWLQTAELFGEGSPLLIVQNEISDRSKQLPIGEMRGKYDFIKDHFQANLKTNRGLDDIHQAIEYQICRLPHVGQDVPKTWKKIRERLTQLAIDNAYLPADSFWKLCDELGVKDPEQAKDLSEYFHDLGVFLHFQDDPRLQNTVILQNEWATDAVYQVIDNEEVKKNFGRFTLDQAYQVWDLSTYQGKQLELLALMENFELCYKIPDQNPETYLVPQLLPVSRPMAHRWDTTDNLQLQYRYEYMPKGLISRFMVRMHHYIRDLDEAWKSGVVLHKEELQAEVFEEFGEDQLIHVRVRGPRRRDFMAVIRDHLDRLHHSYGGIKVQMQIPCNCSECETSDSPYFFKEEVIKRALDKHKREIHCQISFEPVSIHSLLDDLDIQEDEIRFAKESSPRRTTQQQVLDIAEKAVENGGKKEAKKGFWERLNKPLAAIISIMTILGTIIAWYFLFRDADRKDAELDLKKQQEMREAEQSPDKVE